MRSAYVLCCQLLHFRELWYLVVFLFKQKTAYEMRISDWSSDVCSSDLPIVSTTGIPHAAILLPSHTPPVAFQPIGGRPSAAPQSRTSSNRRVAASPSGLGGRLKPPWTWQWPSCPRDTDATAPRSAGSASNIASGVDRRLLKPTTGPSGNHGTESGGE